MSDVRTDPTPSETKEIYLRSIDATLAYIAERLPPPAQSNRIYWLLIANAAALWAIVALMIASRLG